MTINEKQETCNLLISKRSLENLTEVNYIDTLECPISEYLSLILIILSFRKENLRTIVTNLKDNISCFALNLNIHLKTILETKKDTKLEYMNFIEKIIMKNLNTYVRFFKLFKIVE